MKRGGSLSLDPAQYARYDLMCSLKWPWKLLGKSNESTRSSPLQAHWLPLVPLQAWIDLVSTPVHRNVPRVRCGHSLPILVAWESGVAMPSISSPLVRLRTPSGGSQSLHWWDPRPGLSLQLLLSTLINGKPQQNYRCWSSRFKVVHFGRFSNWQLSFIRKQGPLCIQAQRQSSSGLNFMMMISVIWEAGASKGTKAEMIKEHCSFFHLERAIKYLCSLSHSLLPFFLPSVLAYFHRYLFRLTLGQVLCDERDAVLISKCYRLCLRKRGRHNPGGLEA